MFATYTHCWMCGEPVDQTLHHNHPRARTVDHVIPLSKRPDLALDWTNLRLAHRGCNGSRGDRMTAERATVNVDPDSV